MYKFNQLYKSWMSRICIITAILTLLLMIYGLLGGSTKLVPLTTNECFIIAQPSITQSHEDANKRLQMLIALHSQNFQSYVQGIYELEHLRTQYQSIYIVMLAGLASYYLGSKKKGKGVYSVIIITIVMMYLLDVHWYQLRERSGPIRRMFDKTSDSLLHVKPRDSYWYSFDYTGIQRMCELTSERSTYFPQKIAIALHPNFERSVLYLVPLLAMAIMGIFVEMNNNAKSNSS